MTMVSFTLPLKTENEQNRTMGRHWGVKAKKRDRVRAAVGLVAKAHLPNPMKAQVIVRLTRVSAGELDDDGLRAALKSVRDAMASVLKIDDASQLIRFKYRQEPGEAKKPQVRIDVLLGREADDCCDRAGEYNGFGSDSPLKFTCDHQCACHD